MPYRLFFFKSNFMVPDNVRRLERTMRQAKAAGYNGVVLQDFKFQILDRVVPQYHRHANRHTGAVRAEGLNGLYD